MVHIMNNSAEVPLSLRGGYVTANARLCKTHVMYSLAYVKVPHRIQILLFLGLALEELLSKGREKRQDSARRFRKLKLAFMRQASIRGSPIMLHLGNSITCDDSDRSESLGDSMFPLCESRGRMS